PDVFSIFCPHCREPLSVAPDPARPRAFHLDRRRPLERFLDFLPLDSFDPALSLGEGDTPLVHLERLGRKVGCEALYAKNEAQNPTGSFKDRGTAVAVQKAVALGLRRIGTVSTGNMAVSTAAYGARAGLETYVLLKEGTSRATLAAAAIFGPVLVAVRGDYGRLFHDSLALGRELGVYFMNSVDPFRIEGYKVAAFETYFELGRTAPDLILVPLSSGGHLLGWLRAFDDLRAAGGLGRYPTFVGVQAAGCAPLARAFASGKERYERFDKPETIAHAISNPAPPAGDTVLRKIRAEHGLIMAVTDEEMLAAQKLLAAEEGLFVQPESAVTLAGLIQLLESGRVGREERTLLVLTGSGLKAMAALEKTPFATHDLALEGLADGLRRLVRS
ncbi:MAG: threonine synthase, partial [Candidatus Aminicenantes bacterium]|nr:threonine synthase [Candidatus Aminicenantes bacterium]